MSRAPLEGRGAYCVWHEISTRWADNDAYGHVNNTVYYSWFDTAVNAWLIDQNLLQIDGDPIGLVVETGCRYSKPLAYPEPVEIGLAVTEIGKTSVRYALGVFSRDASEVAAQGYFVHVYVARQSRRPVELPPSWRTALESVLSPRIIGSA